MVFPPTRHSVLERLRAEAGDSRREAPPILLVLAYVIMRALIAILAGT